MKAWSVLGSIVVASSESGQDVYPSDMAASSVDQYIEQATAPVGAILRSARQLILKTLPDVLELMKWGAPIYRLPSGQDICYLYGGKEHVNLGFILGAQLDDPNGLLEGAGQKDSRHVRLDGPDLTAESAIVGFLQESAKLA
ncbi:MAG: DUF1801 domain-containing protein [bacterium]|nr:DUF1801 domain-containing protein [bacterium]